MERGAKSASPLGISEPANLGTLTKYRKRYTRGLSVAGLLHRWLTPPASFEIKRIHRRVTVHKRTGCWNFRSMDRLGVYPRVRLSTGWVSVHRWIYEALHGPLPTSDPGCLPQTWVVHHTCENKQCVNPDHLRAVTQSDNVKLSQARKRSLR